MITLALASRSRPKMFCRMVDSIKENTAGEYEIIVGIDDDDPLLREYPTEKNIRYVMGKKRNTSTLFNELYRKARSNIIACIADDVMIETPMWDQYVLAVSRGIKYFFILTNNGLMTNSHHPIISRNIPELFDFKFLNESLTHYYIDPWMEDICRKASICYKMSNVVFRHVRDIMGSETFISHMRDADKDEATYKTTEGVRVEMADKLRKAIDENK